MGLRFFPKARKARHSPCNLNINTKLPESVFLFARPAVAALEEYDHPESRTDSHCAFCAISPYLIVTIGRLAETVISTSDKVNKLKKKLFFLQCFTYQGGVM